VSSGFDSTEKLGAHEVAAWLRRHPAFLQQFPDLALTLVVPRENGSAASLASYQLEVLRDKNRELSRRLQELFANAQENERLAVRTHQLTLALMKQDDAASTLRESASGRDPADSLLLRRSLTKPHAPPAGRREYVPVGLTAARSAGPGFANTSEPVRRARRPLDVLLIPPHPCGRHLPPRLEASSTTALIKRRPAPATPRRPHHCCRCSLPGLTGFTA